MTIPVHFERLARALRTVSACNEAILRATDEAALIADICAIMQRDGDHVLAWGLVCKAGGGAVTVAASGPAAPAARHWRFLDCCKTCPDQTLTALRQGSEIVRDLTGGVLPCHDCEIACSGLRSGAAFPLVVDGVAIGALGIYTTDAAPVDDETRALFSQLARNLAHGIGTLRATAKLRQLSQAVEQSSAAVCIADIHSQVEYVNPRFTALSGYTAEEAMGRDIRFLLKSGRMPEAVYAQLARDLRETGEWRGELLTRRKDGTFYWERVGISVVRDALGVPQNYVALTEDISVEREHIDAIRLRDHALAASHSGVMILDTVGGAWRIVYVNPAFERITGFAAAEAAALDPHQLFGREGDAADVLFVALASGRKCQFALPAVRRDGSPFWLQLSLAPVATNGVEASHFVVILDDVTQQKRYEQELEHQASHDILTGLPNRALVADRLRQAIAAARRDDGTVGVLLLDLDRFKDINDSLGHAVGDRLLVSVAERLRSLLREVDTVARLGGDEFLLVLPAVDGAATVERIANTLVEELGRPFAIGGAELFVAASIGIALYPRDGEDGDTLMRNADVAMYRVKSAGGEGARFFSAQMAERTHIRFSIEAGLRRAIERDELVLHFQPQVDLASGRIRGAEALLRWQHPERGLLPPAEFMAVAEESGLIVPIGEWVLFEACRAARAWSAAGLAAATVAINVSARQFSRHPLSETCRRAIDATGIDPRQIEIDLTESAVASDPQQAMQVMRRLRDLGLQLALDDFGSGYSSLSALKHFPFQRVKIDRSFIADIVHDPGSAAIVDAAIAMAHGFGMQATALGIETPAQLASLRRRGCDDFQGFHFSRPVPGSAFVGVLHSLRTLEDDAPADSSARRTLLLVDDEPGVLGALQRLFRREGYRILVAPSGAEALELLAAHAVQVIISDQRMPQMSGTEFFSRVKSLYPDTIRIVLSGYTDLTAVTDAINHGAIYQFLTKPWDDAMLLDNVRRAFQAWEQARRQVGEGV